MRCFFKKTRRYTAYTTVYPPIRTCPACADRHEKVVSQRGIAAAYHARTINDIL